MPPVRRRRLAPILAVLFLLVPVLEIYVLIQVGHVIGAGWTILLLIADAVFGAWVVKHEGRRAWAALQEALRSGRMPTRELADGALVLIGGTLMISPGFVTDIFGFALILPFTRPLARRLLTAYLARRVSAAVAAPPGATPPGKAHRPGPGSGPVVQGEVVDR